MPNVFTYVEALRDEISKRQQRQVYNLYKSAYRSLSRIARDLRTNGWREGMLNINQVNELMSQVQSEMQKISTGTYNIASSGINALAQGAGKLLVGGRTSFSSSVVNSLITGTVYGGPRSWNLSSAIWGDNSRKMQDIYQIVARGMMLGESTEQIADKLLKYVNPDKLYFWDGPGNLKLYSHKVDYNAQRLVRTLTTHAYQKAVVDATYNDPALIGYKWHANGSRACPICQERDGTVYQKDEVPWDHPNGMCYIEPVYRVDRNNYDDIIAWALSDDGSMPDMDEFMKPYLEMVSPS